MTTLNLSTPDPNLHIARASAIQAYANFEQSLCGLLGQLLNTQPKQASIIFFNIHNARSRNDIISLLLEDRCGEGFKTYWHGARGSPGVPRRPGMFALIRQLDERRNQIVHWHVIGSVFLTGDNTYTHQQMLGPPNFWVDSSSSITVPDLQQFAMKADFVARSVTMFYMVLGGVTLSAGERESWLQIFAQPVLYPPPDNHLLSPNYKAPETPPRSSET